MLHRRLKEKKTVDLGGGGFRNASNQEKEFQKDHEISVNPTPTLFDFIPSADSFLL